MAAGESISADYGDVLLQVVARLQAQIPDKCNEATCYLSLDPDSLPVNPGDHVFVVGPVSGKFREGAFVGGGLNALATHSGCIVKIHCPSLLDQAHRDVQAITSTSLGLIKQATSVLQALSPQETGLAWAPNAGGFNLTSPFTPVGYTLHKNESGAVRSIELSFAFEFDWSFGG